MITKIIEALCQTYKFRNGLVQHTLRLNLIAQLLYSLQVTANESHYSCLSPRKQNWEMALKQKNWEAKEVNWVHLSAINTFLSKGRSAKITANRLRMVKRLLKTLNQYRMSYLENKKLFQVIICFDSSLNWNFTKTNIK